MIIAFNPVAENSWSSIPIKCEPLSTTIDIVRIRNPKHSDLILSSVQESKDSSQQNHCWPQHTSSSNSWNPTIPRGTARNTLWRLGGSYVPSGGRFISHIVMVVMIWPGTAIDDLGQFQSQLNEWINIMTTDDIVPYDRSFAWYVTDLFKTLFLLKSLINRRACRHRDGMIDKNRNPGQKPSFFSPWAYEHLIRSWEKRLFHSRSGTNPFGHDGWKEVWYEVLFHTHQRFDYKAIRSRESFTISPLCGRIHPIIRV
jgi:hypothetical protein